MALSGLVEWPFVFSGLVVGGVVGLTGVGGGALMTPLLVLAFGIHPATAVGTDLLYAGLTKIAGSTVHGVNKAIDWKVVFRLAAGSAPAALLTLFGLSHLGFKSGQAGSAITFALGIALLLTSVSLLFRPWLVARMAPKFDALSDRAIGALTVTLGAALGVLVTISSVGAGAIGVTVLLMLYPRMPTLRIIASDIVHAVPLTLIAGAGHWAMGSVDWRMLASLLVGSIPGIMIASAYAAKAPDKLLRGLLAGVLVLVGAKLALH
ncbi:TSUP family transporter [Rhodoblastus acidophilus]|uniref:Probable membrane transporter protein n=1 Tax=Rhodoblastus acidophilus TaxID=1074 RepID=A0A6N8DPJ7_RHOAC|nr:sulfite exporter TauE/SafE family protein [Rhodoblastus acidophilus]MTV31123.1 TSUP family transporter [Rhodoblastus acidophilus]